MASHFMRMWIPRALEPQLRQLAATRPVVVLTGARQTGKTSTLRRLFPRHGFVSLDLPSEAAQAEAEPAAFLRRHPPPAILDEVQYAPALFQHLKVAVDGQRDRAGQYLLTGSQKFTLMKGVSESLAGRAAIVELAPLAFAEARAACPELPGSQDTVNLRFAREAIGRSKVRQATVICRASNGFQLEDGCRAVPLEELA